MSRYITAATTQRIQATGAQLDNLATFVWCAWIFPVTLGTGGRLGVKLLSDRKQWILQGGAGATEMTTVITTGGTARTCGSTLGAMEPYSVWKFVAWTYITADGGPRLWMGTLDTPVAEMAYASRTDGTSSNTTEGTGAMLLGNRGDFARPFDGRLAHFSMWVPTSGVTAAKLDRLRTCSFHPALATELGWSCRGYWRLAETELAPDLGPNGYNGGITGATAAVDPPLLVMREQRGVRGLARGLAVAR